ncbi:hypothetical protein EVAR_70241_1 [Eumeta japonica]|uniref:Uncharacterized protein n=1 Tax=Eumeta variegata TaxID=151549 RepID=A0A4C2A4Z1_EUMVA|nr:hypothetical protein EVAR_70241_1 [Eumeta japonica]
MCSTHTLATERRKRPTKGKLILGAEERLLLWICLLSYRLLACAVLCIGAQGSTNTGSTPLVARSTPSLPSAAAHRARNRIASP